MVKKANPKKRVSNDDVLTHIEEHRKYFLVEDIGILQRDIIAAQRELVHAVRRLEIHFQSLKSQFKEHLSKAAERSS